MKRCLILILVGQLVFTPPVFSQDLDKKVSCAVFQVYPEDVRPEVIERAAERLRQELRKIGTLRVMEPVDISAAFKGNPQVAEGGLAKPELSKAYLEAKSKYYNFDFTGAIETLDRAVAKVHDFNSTARDRLNLIDVHLLYALLYWADENSKQTMEHFREAARLDPTRELSEYQYSPRTIEMFEAAKKDVADLPAGRLEVISEPGGANVWVNGFFRGLTPLVLDSFPEGRHDLILARGGFQDSYTTVDLAGGLNVYVRLLPGGIGRKGNIVFHEKDVSHENMFEVASSLGGILRVDKVIFFSMEEFAWNKKVYGRMIDVEMRAAHKPVVVQIEDVEDVPFAMGIVAESLSKSAVVDLKSDLKQHTDEYRPEEVVLMGPRGSKTIFKKPLFWIIVGTVLAGAGTGIGLALR